MDEKLPQDIEKSDILISHQNKKYKLAEQIAFGGFGNVWRAIDLQNESIVAVKILQINTRNADQKNAFQKELKLIKEVQKKNCKNIIQFIDYDLKQFYGFLVTEFCNNGSLSDYLKKYPDLTQQQKISIIKQIIKGLETMQSIHIYHRDLKLENIFMQGDTPKLGDFGSAKQSVTQQDIQTLTGTDLYRAPELLDYDQEKHKNYSIDTEVWSIGIVFYEILFGKFIYDKSKMPGNKFKVSQWLKENYEKTKIDYSNNQYISQDIIEILKKMLVVDPKKRISFNLLLKEKIFQQQKYGEYEAIEDSQVNEIPQKSILKVNTATNLDEFIQQEQKIQEEIRQIIQNYTKLINIYNLYGTIKEELQFHLLNQFIQLNLIKVHTQELKDLQKQIQNNKTTQGQQIKEDYLFHHDFYNLKNFLQKNIEQYEIDMKKQLDEINQYASYLNNEDKQIIQQYIENEDVKEALKKQLKEYFIDLLQQDILTLDQDTARHLFNVKNLICLDYILEETKGQFDMLQFQEKNKQLILDKIKKDIQEFQQNINHY